MVPCILLHQPKAKLIFSGEFDNVFFDKLGYLIKVCETGILTFSDKQNGKEHISLANLIAIFRVAVCECTARQVNSELDDPQVGLTDT